MLKYEYNCTSEFFFSEVFFINRDRRGELGKLKWLTKLVVFTLVFLTISSPLHTYAEATEPYPYIGRVIADQAHLHKGATDNYEFVASFKKGETVGVIGTFTNSANEEWLNIAANGYKGWMKKANVTAVKDSPASLYVSSQNAEVRKGASTTYQSVATLDYGQKISIIDSFINSAGSIWYRADLGSVQGWIMKEQLSSTSVLTNAQTIKNASIHSGAHPSYRTVTTLSAQTQLTVFDTFKNSQQEVWYKVETNDGLQGWIQSGNIEAVKENSNTTPEAGSYYVVEIESKIHSGALDSYRVVYQPKLNENLQVIDEFTNNLNQKWYRVQTENGTQGWILASDLQTEPLPDSQVVSNYVYAKTDGVVARKGALSSYGAVETFAKSDDLRVIDTFVNNKNEFWLRIQITDQTAGWVLADQTTNTPKLNATHYLNENGVVRSGALDSYRVLASFPKNSAVYVMDTFVNNNKELWYRVKLETGATGWINASSVTTKKLMINSTYKVGTNNTYLYRGALYTYSKVTKLSYNTSVKVLYEFINNNNQHWYNVQLSNGKKGWVPKPELFTSLSERDFVYPLGQNVLRKSATSSSGSNTKVNAGEQLLYLWTHNEWINVENSKGVRGWILKDQTREFIPNIFQNPKVTQSGNATTLIWDKSLNFSVGNKLLANGVVQLTGSKLHTVLPSQSIKGLKSISATSSAITLTPAPGYMIQVRNNSKQAQVKVMPIGLAGKKIVIDAGHGDHDPGAIGPTKLREKDVTLDVSKKLKAELERQGATVILTRSDDTYLTLAERVAIANAADNDAFISIHANANVSTSARGTETYYNTAYNFNGPRSSILAGYIQDSLVDRINTYDRGTKTANFYVIKNNELPSALVEIAFISNPNEESMLKSDIVRGQAAVGIAEGIKKYFTGGY